MSRIDEFESMFKRAGREPYVYEEVPIDTVALVTDGARPSAQAAGDTLQQFLPRLASAATWNFIVGSDFANVGQLLERLEAQPVDLIVTYRHLSEESLVPQHSLGVYLDVLTQATAIPVLVLPGTAAHPISLEGRASGRVMVVTDHISGDNRLINFGVRMCSTGGEIWLCHVEDDVVFERYMQAIERIPEIDTQLARELIDAQLLKEAKDFALAAVAELQKKISGVEFHASISRGHWLREYQQLANTHDIDLMVANTKDKDQLAMHGITYALSVEMTDLVMLLL